MRGRGARFTNGLGNIAGLGAGGTITGDLVITGDLTVDDITCDDITADDITADDVTFDLVVAKQITLTNTGGSALITAWAGDPNTAVTGAKGSLVMDSTNGKLYKNTDGATAYSEVGGAAGGDFTAANTITATMGAGAFGGNHNWAPTGYVSTTQVIFVNVQDGGSQSLTGLTGGVDGRVVTIVNIPSTTPTTGDWSFATQSASSTDVNRFHNTNNNGVGLKAAVYILRYFGGAVNRWVIMSAYGPNA